MSRAYYNEFDPKAAAWLRELIKAGHIAPGDVDERSITDVPPSDLTPYAQCHFFAGIGGWSYALRLAGVPDSVPVWTGSCPCQPFSGAGKKKGTKDERHLWPSFARLIEARQPPVVFGEQVASSDGRVWLNGVFSDLEDMGYRPAGADLCAASVGAPHIRQRLYWVADTTSQRRCRGQSLENTQHKEFGRPGSSVCLRSWPDGAGSESTLTVPDVLSSSYGVPGRVGLLRGYGNAIVPQVAAEFIQAALEAMYER